MNQKGQINASVLTIIGGFLFASISLSWNAVMKSDKAIEQSSEVRESVAEIRTDVRWIKETLAGMRGIALASSSQPIDGHK